MNIPSTPSSRGVIVIGGGLAGLLAAVQLIRRGIPVTLFERKKYPFHRVCGEYISNETVPFLKAIRLFPAAWEPPQITQLQLTSVNGRSAEIPLDMGGFGISRFVFDNFIYGKAVEEGVRFHLENEVTGVSYTEEYFKVVANHRTYEAAVVIGAHGKRSKLDYLFDRAFIHKRSPYVGVKYHIRTAHPASLIAIHNFKNGYCGISNVENGKSNLCYLTHRDNIKEHGDIRLMEERVLFRNPFLKSIFQNSDFLLERPEVINEISFETKAAMEHHVLMTGDAAGMITPLCGNGMAMAIHSSKMVSEWVGRYFSGKIVRHEMESGYAREWNSMFSKRLWVGRQVQRLFGGEATSNFAVNLARYSKPVTRFLVSKTHGETF